MAPSFGPAGWSDASGRLIRKIDPQVDVNDVMARVRKATLAAARDGVADPNGWRQMASATPALQELLAT